MEEGQLQAAFVCMTAMFVLRGSLMTNAGRYFLTSLRAGLSANTWIWVSVSHHDHAVSLLVTDTHTMATTEDDDDNEELTLDPTPARSKPKKSSPRGAGKPQRGGGRGGRGGRGGGAPAVDWAALGQKLPVGSTKADKEQRRLLFSLMDPNGNGFLSLAEVDKGVKVRVDGA